MTLRAWTALLGVLSAVLPAHAANLPVDLELVIAVDVSASMDREEYLIQRAGYVAAIRDPEFIESVLSGDFGRIALTYVEWSGVGVQRITMPWRLIDSAGSARAFAEELRQRPLAEERGTSLSAALLFSASLFPGNAYDGTRRVIDVSGDGPNNYGPPVTEARDFVVDAGIVINGLPILIRPSPIFPDMDDYYRDCVIGGDGAFVQAVRDVEEFRSAIKRKLLKEVRVAAAPASPPPVLLAAAAAPVDCLIGERERERTTGAFYPGLDN